MTAPLTVNVRFVILKELKQLIPLKGYFTSGKMNVYLKWVIYVEEM